MIDGIADRPRPHPPAGCHKSGRGRSLWQQLHFIAFLRKKNAPIGLKFPPRPWKNGGPIGLIAFHSHPSARRKDSARANKSERRPIHRVIRPRDAPTLPGSTRPRLLGGGTAWAGLNDGNTLAQRARPTRARAQKNLAFPAVDKGTSRVFKQRG
jgi:hypothetical protein